MAKVSKTYRFDGELVDRVAAYAAARGSTATDVFASGAQMLLGMAEGGVPDLPPVAVVTPVPKSRRPATDWSETMGVRQARLNAAKGL